MGAAPGIRFGRFTVETASRQVLVDGKPARLGARAFDLLQVLASEPGRIIGKRELIARVWPDSVVEENNLQVQVCALRKLLGSGAIVTVPGRGYGLVPDAFPEASDGAPGLDGHGDESLASLYGREAEMRALRELMDGHRLVSLAGPGGVGKTRLADALARLLAARYPAGVFTIELADCSDASSVATACINGLRAARDASPGVAAARFGDAAPLLILENCERVVDAAAETIQAMLAQAPHAHALATSQAPLRVEGEQVFRLAPLALPRDDSLDAASCRLFVETVRSVQPGHAVADGQVHDIAAICRALDGVPLAVELAASRVPVLGIAGVRRSLPDRLRVLRGHAHGRPARLQSLRGSLDWSWSLLDEQERGTLVAAARLQGAFTLAQLQHALPDNDGWDVMERLSALVDKSLVLADAPARFRLFESTRIYAAERGGAPATTRAPAARSRQAPADRRRT